MQSRVLFVDDEPLILELYESLSDELRENVELCTAKTGEEALEHLSERTADIVVSDLEMPDMNGGEFLSIVERAHPNTMRVVVSGYFDQLAVARCLMYGHRYYQKPIIRREFVDGLNRLFRLKELFNNPKLKLIVGSSTSLPSPPETYLRVTEALDCERTSLDEVAAIIEIDPALTAKLLQIVNSAHFGLSGQVTTALESIQMLGVEVLRGLMLGLQAKSFAEKKAKRTETLNRIWHHALDTALRARELSRVEKLPVKERQACFTAALLHDVGKMVLAANAESEYEPLAEIARERKMPLHKLETEVFGGNHADIGAYLLGLWGLPEPIVFCAQAHHSLNALTLEGFSPVACVHAAQNILPKTERFEELDEAFYQRAGLSRRIPVWRDAIEDFSSSKPV